MICVWYIGTEGVYVYTFYVFRVLAQCQSAYFIRMPATKVINYRSLELEHLAPVWLPQIACIRRAIGSRPPPLALTAPCHGGRRHHLPGWLTPTTHSDNRRRWTVAISPTCPLRPTPFPSVPFTRSAKEPTNGNRQVAVATPLLPRT